MVAAAPTSWLRCDDRDPDAGRFTGRLLRALQAHLPARRGDVRLSHQARLDRAVAAVDTTFARLQKALREDVVLVIDDLQAATPGSEVALIVEALTRDAPDKLHLVLISRRELPFSLARPRGQGLVAEIDAPDLAFGVADIEVLLRTSVGADPPDLADRVWERTGGWPAALCGAVELLRGLDPDGRTAALELLSRPGERFHGYLAEEVVAAEPEPIVDMLRKLAICGEVGVPEVIASGIDDGSAALAELTRRGLVRRAGALLSLMPPLADYFEHDPTLAPGDRALLQIGAARDCVARLDYAAALRHLIGGGAHAAAAALLAEHGAELTDRGRTDAVLETARLPSRYLEDPRVQWVLGQALQVRGHWSEAMTWFLRAGRNDLLDPALAWRLAALALGQGELGEVLAVCERAGSVVGVGVDTTADAHVATLAATAMRLTGDLDGARAEIARVEATGHTADARVRAAVRHVQAQLAAADGDRRLADARWADAIESAEAAGDLLEVTWIRAERAGHLVDVGSPRQAAAEADAATRVAHEVGAPFLIAQAATARARAWVRLGMLDEAQEAFDAAVEILQGLGSRLLARPLCGLGELYRIRCRPARARAAYEAALGLSEPVGDVLGVRAALIGLARVRAGDDLDAAWSLAGRACAGGDGQLEVVAVLTRGWVALLRGDLDAAAGDAATADAAARARRDAPGAAEAITLATLSAPEGSTRPGRFDEAMEIYRESGYRLEEAAVRVIAGRTGCTPRDAPAEETLRAAGVDLDTGWVVAPFAVTARVAPALSIRALGPFQVVRDGVPIPRTAWQSKKARDLLKILVARRRPVPREQLIEFLWPEVDPARAGNRLSVLLSMVRDVLATGADEPVVADGNAIALNPACVRVDVEAFLADADAALAAHRSGRPDAVTRLGATVSAYTGAFLEDDPYPDWALPLAEELRATHIAALQALAVQLRQAHDVDGTVRCTLRLLIEDPYDETAHLALVDVLSEAGRLGEARRHFQNYVRRMAEIGVPPRPWPRGAVDGSRLRVHRRLDLRGS